MTPAQIAVVQRHFGRVYPVKGALAQKFYDHLFEIAPEARDLFPQNMSEQREKLSDTLAMLVKHLNSPKHVEVAIQGMARRHRGYGARPEHFAPVGEALIYALDAYTDGGMSPEQKDGWIAAYTLITDSMAPYLTDSAA